MISKSYNIFGASIEGDFGARIIVILASDFKLTSNHLLIVDLHLQLLNDGLLILWVH